MAFRDAVGWWWVALAGGFFINALVVHSGIRSVMWVVLGGMFLALGLVSIMDPKPRALDKVRG